MGVALLMMPEIDQGFNSIQTFSFQIDNLMIAENDGDGSLTRAIHLV